MFARITSDCAPYCPRAPISPLYPLGPDPLTLPSPAAAPPPAEGTVGKHTFLMSSITALIGRSATDSPWRPRGKALSLRISLESPTRYNRGRKRNGSVAEPKAVSYLDLGQLQAGHHRRVLLLRRRPAMTRRGPVSRAIYLALFGGGTHQPQIVAQIIMLGS